MLRVATVLSAREWEARLVAAARDSAAVKLVLRAYLPEEVSRRADGIDIVVAGSETPWVTPARVADWQRLGIRVVGIHPRADRPAAERLEAGGADLVLVDDLDPEQLVREIRLLEPKPGIRPERSGHVVVVTGSRGSPGRTEVATALAWLHSAASPTVLLDADLAAPAVAVRLGLPPRPDVADCVDAALDGDSSGSMTLRSIGRLTVIPGALRSSAGGTRADAVVDVAQALARDRTVVVDAGPWREASAFIESGDSIVFIAEASPVGIVRASQMAESWRGPQPTLVLNKVPRSRADEMVRAVRRWSGLDPAAAIPRRRAVAQAAVAGRPPHRSLLRATHRLVDIET